MMRFDLADLRLFLHVAEAGSITAGAAVANLALASASERLRGMEEFAGTALLERLHRGVALTAAGHALVRHARDLLDVHERMRADLSRFGLGLRGHVRIFANTSAISEHLPEPLSGFLSAHPQVDVDLKERLSHEVFEAILSGRADVGVASDQVEKGALDTYPFRQDHLVMVSTKDHPLAGRRRISFAETLAFQHVVLGSGAALHDHLAAQARRLGKSVVARAQVRGFDAVCRMAEHGVGVGIVPAASARRARRSMTIRVTALSVAWATRSLVVATRKGEQRPYVRALVERLVGEQGKDTERFSAARP
jgi:DNA-binding transcriptional LysR family regulator